MAQVKKDIVVNVPVRTAYDQWTQFETFPQFMDGVKEVVQLDEKTLRWRAEIAGKDEEWEAVIVEQRPDAVISWRSTAGAQNAGTVSFEPLDGGTRVTLHLSYEPKGAAEKTGEVLGMVDRQVDSDLRRFKEFIESRGAPTGAWRGEVTGGRVEKGSGPRP